MLKRKALDYNNNIKRVCYDKSIISNKTIKTLFGHLPNELIFNILLNLDIVDIKKLELNIPILNIYISKISFKLIDYDNNEKERLLFKTFETKNINIIKFVFDNIKYYNFNEILINFDQFEKVVSYCVRNNYIEGINFLFEWKKKHWDNHLDSKCKDFFESSQFKQFQITLQQFNRTTADYYNSYDNNQSNLIEIVISKIFYHNNLDLFDYIKQNCLHNNHFINSLENMQEFIFVADNHMMLHKYISFLEEYNINNNINLQITYEMLFEDAFQSRRFNCILILLKKHRIDPHDFINMMVQLTEVNNDIEFLDLILNNYKFKNDDFVDTIVRILRQNNYNCFNILYKYKLRLFTKKNIDNIIDDILLFENNVETVKFLLKKFKRKIEDCIHYLLKNKEFDFFNDYYKKSKLMPNKVINNILGTCIVYEDIDAIKFLLEKFNRNNNINNKYGTIIKT